jgi:hypothetical protein
VGCLTVIEDSFSHPIVLASAQPIIHIEKSRLKITKHLVKVDLGREE